MQDSGDLEDDEHVDYVWKGQTRVAWMSVAVRVDEAHIRWGRVPPLLPIFGGTAAAIGAGALVATGLLAGAAAGTVVAAATGAAGLVPLLVLGRWLLRVQRGESIVLDVRGLRGPQSTRPLDELRSFSTRSMFGVDGREWLIDVETTTGHEALPIALPTPEHAEKLADALDRLLTRLGSRGGYR